MLTGDARKVLRDLKQCGAPEGSLIGFSSDLGDDSCWFIPENDETGREFPCRFPAPKMRSILKFLQEEGFIDLPYQDIISIRHAARHSGSLKARRMLLWILRSIFVPILFSAATDLVTLWLKGYFGQ